MSRRWRGCNRPTWRLRKRGFMRRGYAAHGRHLCAMTKRVVALNGNLFSKGELWRGKWREVFPMVRRLGVCYMARRFVSCAAPVTMRYVAHTVPERTEREPEISSGNPKGSASLTFPHPCLWPQSFVPLLRKSPLQALSRNRQPQCPQTRHLRNRTFLAALLMEREMA